jgi:ketosteroid isomerase-like protein
LQFHAAAQVSLFIGSDPGGVKLAIGYTRSDRHHRCTALCQFSRQRSHASPTIYGDDLDILPASIVRSFYGTLGAGDTAGALDLMAPDIEWITMWHYKVDGRGPQAVVEGLFKPLTAEWSSFALVPTEFITEDPMVVSLGDFTGVHGATGKFWKARYAHVCTVNDGKIARFRQYIDTLAIAQARVA